LTYALIEDGGAVVAGTSRGLYRLDGGVWSEDGLAGQPVFALARAGGITWAISGGNLYARRAGVWTRENGLEISPFCLLGDGDSLFVGGYGIARWESGRFTTIAAPRQTPSAVVAMCRSAGGLIVAFSQGGAARFESGRFTRMDSGLRYDESVHALAEIDGVLWAGTSFGLKAWDGVAWRPDDGFGRHDIRAFLLSGATLRAATYDAGVWVRESGSWVVDNAGLLSTSASCLAVAGGSLYVGTYGAPVYRRDVDRWIPAGTGLRHPIATAHAYFCGPIGGCASVFGYGGAGVTGSTLPDGCGDVRSLVISGFSRFAATGCGVVDAGAVPAPRVVNDGLPPGTNVLALAEAPSSLHGIFAGTSSGLFHFSGGSWSRDDAGLPASAEVQCLSTTGDSTLAAVGARIFERMPPGDWVDVSEGLPTFSGFRIRALGATGYAATESYGLYRRDPGAPWRHDDAGIRQTYISAIDGPPPLAGAGWQGVFRYADGGWISERTGLPSDVDVRVVARADPTGRVKIGTAGDGVFSAKSTPTVRTLPVVLDVEGNAGSRFRTELTLLNRSTHGGPLSLSFVPAPDFGQGEAEGGTVSVNVPQSTALRVSDALDLLRAGGLKIPPATPSHPIAGSLTISPADGIAAVARTYHGDGAGGTFGLSYPAVSDIEAAEDVATVYGLREKAGDVRSNLAVTHLPGRSTDPVTLSVQVYAANGEKAGDPLVKTLAPGEWFQWNRILATAGLPDDAFGYARITRTSGIGAWTAYGVLNDDVTSDGSYLPAYRPGGLSAVHDLVVPVVLDAFGKSGSHFTTELTLANESLPVNVALGYEPAPGFGPTEARSVVVLELAANAEVFVPDIVQYLRERGAPIPDARKGAQAGSLSVSFRSLYDSDHATVALARTKTPSPGGGSFGVSYRAIAGGHGARRFAVVPGLVRDTAFRSNLAVVNAGGGSSEPLTLSVKLFDASTAMFVGKTLSVSLWSGQWSQWSDVLEAAGAPAGIAGAYAVVERVGGDGPFFAYGVVNDNVTSDGTFLEPSEME